MISNPVGSQPSREHLGDDTTIKTALCPIRFLFIAIIENAVLLTWKANEDLIRLSVRRFLSQISSSVPWLTTTPVGLCEWIRFVENHTSAYRVLGNHHVQRHCHQTLRADWCYREACDWKYFGGNEGSRPRHWQSCDVCCLQSRGLHISSKDVPE